MRCVIYLIACWKFLSLKADSILEIVIETKFLIYFTESYLRFSFYSYINESESSRANIPVYSWGMWRSTMNILNGVRRKTSDWLFYEHFERRELP